MITTIKNATIVNDGQVVNADIVIENEIIADIVPEGAHCTSDTCFNASGCIVMPGIIDTHVHFREPGMTDKADIASESAAAAAGGVTSYSEMPNTKPQTVTPEALEEKFMLARNKSIVNYSFFFGATSGNINDIHNLDRRRVCGVKVFMGSSTGNMLVDNKNALYDIFSSSTLPIVTHCEDTGIISENARRIRELYGNEADVSLHPFIRSEEACFKSTELAIELARETGAQLHVAHISTAKELELFDALSNKITAEACLPHLIFSEEDYATKKALIKCNPAIKSKADREALRKGLTNGKIRHRPRPTSVERQGRRCVAGRFGHAVRAILSHFNAFIERQRHFACNKNSRTYGTQPCQTFQCRESGLHKKRIFRRPRNSAQK